MSHPPDPASTRRIALIAAELGLLVLGLGVGASFTRLFIDWGWLARLAIPLIAAWGVGVATRRGGLRVGAATLVHVLVAVPVLSWVFAPGTLLVVLPTPTTATFLRDQVDVAFSSFSDLVAPVPAEDGFLVVIAAGLWVIAAFADTAAIRFRAPLQAAIPYVSSFAAVGILARDSGRTAAAVLFALSLAVYAATQQALAASQRRWVAGRAALGTRAVFTATLAVGLVAVLGGMALGPRLPGGTEPVVDLRDIGKGNGPRTVVSPFVGLRSLLGERSDEVMFTVRADHPAYWRLTSLEEFDAEREIWVSRVTFQRTNGDLPAASPGDVPGETLGQEYRIQGLAGLWMPAAFVPRQVASDEAMNFDAQSSSLILRDRTAEPGLSYGIESTLPDPSAALGAGPAPLRAELDPQYLVDPQLDPSALGLATSVTAEATDPYQQMLALQNWFRAEFTYDDRVDFSGEPDALGAFLSTRRGFCQQFASAFAQFARALGVPSRVAVGFTPGDPVPFSEPGAEEGDPVVTGAEFVVRGRHAHAWPEVYFEGVGWVPFEPTPQRGNPQAEDYTGVAPAQAVAPPEQAATTTSTTVPPSTFPSTSTPRPDRLDATAEPEPDREDPAGRDLGSFALVAAGALAVLLAVAATARMVWRGRRRRGDDRAAREAVAAAAWSDALRSLGQLGMRPAPAETPVEFARRADERLGGPLMAPLALVETRRRFSASGPSPEACELARRSAAAVGEHVREVTTRRQRVGSLLGR